MYHAEDPARFPLPLRRRARSARACLLAAAVAVVLCGWAHAVERLPGEADAPMPVHAFGRTAPMSSAPDLAEASGGELDMPAGLRELEPGRVWQVIEVAWPEVQPTGGDLDLEPVRRALDRAEAEGAGPRVLALSAEHPDFGRWGEQGFEAPPSAGGDTQAAVDRYRRAWLGAIRAISRELGPEIDWYLLADLAPPPGAPRAAEQLALEVKTASVTLRAEDPGAAVAVRVPAGPAVALLAEAYRKTGDLDAYIEGVSLATGTETPVRSTMEDARARLREVDPGTSVWVELGLDRDLEPEELADRALARAAEWITAGADLALLPLAGAAEATLGPAVTSLARPLSPALGLSPGVDAGISLAEGYEQVEWIRLFDEQSFREVVLYWSTERVEEEEAQADFLFRKLLRRGYQTLDPMSERLRFAPSKTEDDKHERVSVPLSRRPRLILINRLKTSPGFEMDQEEADVESERNVTAAEIIAAHQRRVAFQDERLESIIRESEIKLRIRYAQVTGTIELALRGDYFWEPDTGSEWSIREKFLNGVKVTWDKIPELPFLEQEAVVQAPFDLELDKRYQYERDGVEEVRGRTCWKLDFEPLDDESESRASLYRGTAWIDQVTGALVKVTTIQTELEPPLISDEETQYFAPFEGPGGIQYWIVDEVDGQQIYTVAGSNLVVQRKITFKAPQINAEDFEQKRSAVYGSELQMLRDTPEGYKWLERTEEGERVVNEEGDPTQLFAAAGALRDESTDGVLPLAGINYTNIDTFGKGMVFNLFFAGVFANATLTDPSFLGTGLDLGVNASLVGFRGTERQFVRGEEIEAENVDRRTQSLTFTAGYPLGSFLKLRGVLDFNFRDYDEADETAETFTVPTDHVETEYQLELAYDRRGWGILAEHGWLERSDWDPWGPADDLASAEEVARAETARRWGLGLTKSFFLPYFQQIELSARYQGGEDLDRFSKYTFGFLGGDRLRGFGGSGIRYDRGVLGQVQYSFNIQEVVRFDATLDHAEVHDIRLSDETTSHTGFGIAANFLGPWQTLIRLDTGYALSSDLDAVEGDFEFIVVALRLFD
jgi:hypothetical protein